MLFGIHTSASWGTLVDPGALWSTKISTCGSRLVLLLIFARFGDTSLRVSGHLGPTKNIVFDACLQMCFSNILGSESGQLSRERQVFVTDVLQKLDFSITFC